MRRGRIVAAVMAVGLVAGACTGGGSSSKNVLRIGTDSTIDSLNPFVAFNQDAYTAFEYTYPYLVQYDTRKVAAGETGDTSIAADFATSWETSKDALTWTFHTRPGAKWSDGKPLTARDAAFTMNMILQYAKGPTSNTATLLLHATGAEAPDANTLVLHYQVPVSNVLSQLQQLPILPQHVWAPLATGTGTEIKSFKNPAPVVSGGPFILKDYRPKDFALWTRNPNYYGPRPKIDGFGLEMFRNDDAMIQALKTGEIDMIEGGGGYVPPTSVQPLKDAGFTVPSIEGMSVNDFIINSNQKKPKNRELLDPRVRRAFEHAIDRQQIVQNVWQGLGKPEASLIPPADGVWHNPNLEPAPFDIAQANKILDQAGYKRGAGDIRMAGDHQMSYTVLTPDDLTGVDRTFTLIQGNFADIGVKLAQRSMDSSALFAFMTAPGDTGYLHWDLALWNWVPLIDPDFILSVMTCAQWGGWGDSGYCDRNYDNMYAKQGTLVDQNARKQLVWDMQQKLVEDRPYIILNTTNVTDAYDKDWTGFVMTQQGSFNPLSKESLSEVHFAG